MKDKELLILAQHFYIESDKAKCNKKMFDELIKSVSTIAKKLVRNEQGIAKALEGAYKRLESITKGKEIECNAFILSVGSLMLLLEDNYFKGSTKMKISRLVRDIYTDIEKYQKNDDGFRNANRIISKLGESYE